MVKRHIVIASLPSGLFAAGIFLLMLMVGLGFPVLFLSLVPLFSAGLGRSPNHALAAGLIASAIILLLTGSLKLSLVFNLLLTLPAWHFCYFASRSLNVSGARLWYPVGGIMAQLSLYGCVFIGLATLYYSSEAGGISTVVSQQIRESFAKMPEYTQMANVLAEHWNFVLLSALVWTWAIALYGNAWLANRNLLKKHTAMRESLAVTPFMVPGWILYFLMVAALASLIGSESMQFAGKACFIALLLPYFFLGLALIHQLCANWPNRKFFLFFIYLIMVSQMWATLIVAFFGFIDHLRQINKRLSSGRISPK